MIKKISAAALALLMLLAVGCKGEDVVSQPDIEVSAPVSSVDSEPEPESDPVFYTNPLTGAVELEDGKNELRPVAVMIDNDSLAQKVQVGLGDADIVYETEVEGGVTRLMAVFQDISSVGQLGDIRSARYPYIDLAMGHNAVFIHSGSDPTYARPHLKDVNHIDISEKNYGKRISNTAKSWQNMYTFGDKLAEGLKKEFKMQNSKAVTWQKFAAEEESVTLDAGLANTVSVKFSGSQTSKFTYDAATGLYTRYTNGRLWADYKSAENMTVKNVVILLTSITNYPDGKHRKVALQSGDGFYVTNGGYTPIKWSKGNSSSALKFTNTDGSELTMSIGNTWVCIADKAKSVQTFE